MKTFKVKLERRIIEETEVEVRAKNKKAAQTKAIEKVESDPDTKWEFCVADAGSSPWVWECYEVEK